MKVAILGSGSRGNAVAIRAGSSTILIDAGFSPRSLDRRLNAAGFPQSTVTGVVLTHEHGDHVRGAAAIARRSGCAVYASRGTLTALAHHLKGIPTVRLIPHSTLRLGSLAITACRTSHDAAEPIAVAVDGPLPGQRVGLAYDLGRPTAAVRYLLQRAACLIVEANHDEVMLRTASYPPTVRRRISGNTGHLSNRAAAEFLSELCHRALRRVVLVHVSEQCNRPDLAETTVRAALSARGFSGEVLVSCQDEALPAFEVEGSQMGLWGEEVGEVNEVDKVDEASSTPDA